MLLGKSMDHTIVIEPSLNNGFSVRVGCAGPFVFESIERLLEDLKDYLNNQDVYIKSYNVMLPTPQEVPVPPGQGGIIGTQSDQKWRVERR